MSAANAGTHARRLLLVAFHYPPFATGSGYKRAVAMCRYLPDCDWRPVVLTATRSAYVDYALDAGPEGSRAGAPASPEPPVLRAPALDARHHLGLAGRYPDALGVPDRWSTWIATGVAWGLAAIARWRPAAILSTYPIASAHVIASVLHRLTGLPWVADFRDPMVKIDWPDDPRVRRAHLWVERRAATRSALALLTTETALAEFRERYPHRAPETSAVIANGYDERDFDELPDPAGGGAAGRCVLLHSGMVGGGFRDPGALVRAVARLRESGRIRPGAFELRFRVSGPTGEIEALAGAHGVADVVTAFPETGHREALAEVASASALLVLQGAAVNQQIPAKLYEYLRAARPIVALADGAGATAGLMRSLGLGWVAPIDDVGAIEALLLRLLDAHASGSAEVADPAVVARYSRAAQMRELARRLDALQGEAG